MALDPKHKFFAAALQGNLMLLIEILQKYFIDVDIHIKMTKEELLKSGILELYVLGEASKEEVSNVTAMLEKYPDLKNEIKKISDALEVYAKTTSINPSPKTKTQLFDQLKNDTSTNVNETRGPKQGGGGFRWLSVVLGILSLGLLYGYFANRSNINKIERELEVQIAKCDSIQNELNNEADLFAQISGADNKILNIQATENYAETSLYFHNNPASQRNFIQVVSLPEINQNQSYQLWSLKGDLAIPLDVFQGEGDNLFEVEFEPDTDAYAITIEPRGGRQTPTLENLIGVIPVS